MKIILYLSRNSSLNYKLTIKNEKQKKKLKKVKTKINIENVLEHKYLFELALNAKWKLF